MNKNINRWALLTLGIMFLLLLSPESSFASFGGLESKMNNLNNVLTSRILPIISTFGLLYAAFLAVTGDATAKGRMIMVLGCSILGFLAGPLIGFLKSILGFWFCNLRNLACKET